MSSTINIALAADPSYFVHARVMLCSLFENNKANVLSVFLFTEQPAHSEIDKIKKLSEDFGQSFQVVPINAKLFKGFYIRDDISLATYYRLVIPQLLPETIEKILYLDTDLIIKKDLAPLWNTVLQDYCIGAVNEKNKKHAQRLSLESDEDYFNAGVLLINVQKWRQLDISARGLEIAGSHKEKLLFYDQDVLNILLARYWFHLPSKWNQTEGERLGYLYEEPTIIHFVGKKPWSIHCTHPYKKEYYHYYYQMEGLTKKVIDKSNHIIKALKNRILPVK